MGQILAVDGVPADKGQCSQVPVSWAMAVFPGVAWSALLPEVGSNGGVDEWAGKSTKYFTWIENNHADVNQLPLQGDIMVFGATPAKGYSNTFSNPDGHTGVCDSATPTGYTIVQQNAPNFGESVNDSSYPWKLNPCLGWFRAVNQPANVTPLPSPSTPAAPAPSNSINVGKNLNLPKTITQWHVYNVAGPYDLAHATHILDPAKYGGLSYVIQKDLGNGIYAINTQDFGQVAIYTKDTVATIS
ncbi:MAG: hypothetical protein ACREGF_06540 [Candidatus Saccharimonadales bacterium]